ncbi:MAG: iron ABC transporter permease [bacterium]
MKTPDKNSRILILTTFGLTSLVILAVCPVIGSHNVTWKDLFAEPSISREIFVKTRLPRVMLAMVVGSALACAGAVFQSLFRNALASPFTLGTASGGSLGAVLAIKAGLDITLFGFSLVSLGAFIGSLTAVAVVYSLSRSSRGITTSTMLLSGVTVGFFFSAIVMFIHYMSDFAESRAILVWTMGSLSILDYRTILRIFPLVFIPQLIFIFMARNLNQMCMGEELAASRGVNIERTKIWSFFLASLMIGASVSVAGPIGFVGLIVPHIIRLLTGNDYRVLIPCCIFGGGSFLAICDTIARILISPAEIPVGVITAMLGGPFFLWLLLRKRISMEI